MDSRSTTTGSHCKLELPMWDWAGITSITISLWDMVMIGGDSSASVGQVKV